MRARQRGFGWIGVVFYLGIAAVAFTAYKAWTHSLVEEGRKEIRDKWAPIIAKCDEIKGKPDTCLTDWTTAVRQREEALAANKTLKASIDGPGGLKEQLQACSDNTQALADGKHQADAEKQKALGAAQSALAALQADRKRQLSTPVQGGTCEQVVGRVIQTNNEIATREFRDRPPTPAEAADLMGLSPKPADAHAPDPRLRVQ